MTCAPLSSAVWGFRSPKITSRPPSCYAGTSVYFSLESALDPAENEGKNGRRIMEVFEATRTVLAIRAYSDKPVPPDLIRRIVEAGRLSASSMNNQPWHFIVVENRKTLRAVSRVARTGPYIEQAPLAIVVAIEKTRFAVSDASRAIQSMILTAWSEGVGSNWVGFFGLDEIGSLLHVPKELDVLAVIPFGYPAQSHGRGRKRRKALSEVAHREDFRQPFE